MIETISISHVATYDEIGVRIDGLKKVSFIYGANGTDIFQRKCPECGGAKPGIPF